jgi:hypothetical protein
MRWRIALLCGLVAAGVAGVVIATGHSARPHASVRFQGPGPRDRSGLRMIPFPGTPDASPTSHVIMSSLQRRQIGSLTVTGSVTGRHRGRLTVLPDGAGTAFVPARPFAPGERVRVVVRPVDSPGHPARRMHFSFGVAVRGSLEHTAPSGSKSHTKPPPSLSFHSQPGLHPTPVVAGPDPDKHSGDIFVTPNNTSQNGAMILNGRGQLVWFLSTHHSTFNLSVQHYQGQPVLTWWQGKVQQGGWAKSGEDVIMDRSYRVRAVVRAGNGYAADLHDFQITPHGTALIDAFVPVQADLSHLGGPKHGTVFDCVIQRIDIRTGQVLWEWHALGHVPLSASFRRPEGSKPFDFFHLNSIQQLPNGNLLVSARNTWGIYEISGATGKILWTLGGKHSNFRAPPGAIFEWQHDARQHGQLLTLFNDAWDGVDKDHEEDESSAKVLRLGRHKVTLVHRFTHHPSVLASSEGNVQTLPNGNLFVGWGADPDFSEITPDGRQIFNGHFPKGVNSYRAYRLPWHAQPHTPPSISVAAQPGGAGLTVWASWNGATDVATWRALGGANRGHLSAMARKPVRNFETSITLPRRVRYVEVQALNASGKVLGTSGVRKAF